MGGQRHGKDRVQREIKNEPPDPDALSRFKDFTRRILSVRKSDVKNTDNSDSRSTDPRDEPEPS